MSIVGTQAAVDKAKTLVLESLRAHNYDGGKLPAFSSSGNQDTESSHGLMPPSSAQIKCATRAAAAASVRRPRCQPECTLTPTSSFIESAARMMRPDGRIPWVHAVRAAAGGRAPSSVTAAIDMGTQTKTVAQIAGWYLVMKDAGAVPTELTFQDAVDAFAKVSDIDGTTRWVQAMLHLEMKPRFVILNTAIKNCCSQYTNPYECRKWLQIMMDAGGRGVSRETFNCVIANYAKRRDPVNAVQWFEYMLANGVLPNTVTFTCIVDAHAKANDVTGAERWFEAMCEQSGGCRLDVCIRFLLKVFFFPDFLSLSLALSRSHFGSTFHFAFCLT